ncbi:MAG: hypothetical protein WCF44_03170, partial [Candidatus Methylophosphatis roskildensis]
RSNFKPAAQAPTGPRRNERQLPSRRLLLRTAALKYSTGRSGSGHDSHLFEFIAGKPPLKFRFLEAAIRQ